MIVSRLHSYSSVNEKSFFILRLLGQQLSSLSRDNFTIFNNQEENWCLFFGSIFLVIFTVDQMDINPKTSSKKVKTVGIAGDGMILDIDANTKQPLVEIHRHLAAHLKDHQRQGIEFMFKCVIGSTKKVDQKGSGCILAHCMGLGKTFQVIALVHTLLTNDQLKQSMKKVLILAPVNAIKHWLDEFNLWLYKNDLLNFSIYDFSEKKSSSGRDQMLKSWSQNGGVLIMGINLFSRLMPTSMRTRRQSLEEKSPCNFRKIMTEPGPDLMVVDEGHFLKNKETSFNRAVNTIPTMRRIILTGTPLQNNLSECHVMVSFVRSNLLGEEDDFKRYFRDPISRGQYSDSTGEEVQFMKRRAYVLHQLLSSCVQRFDYCVLRPYLPPKTEFVLNIRLSEIQTTLYRYYLNHRVTHGLHKVLLDFSQLRLIWNHPGLLHRVEEEMVKENPKKGSKKSTEEEGVAQDDKENLFDGYIGLPAVDEDDQTRNKVPRMNVDDCDMESLEADWFREILPYNDKDRIEYSTKMIVLFTILDKCDEFNDKLIIFSQSLGTLDYIESFLKLRALVSEDSTKRWTTWTPNLDYLRIDGSTSGKIRKSLIDKFNDPRNPRARLFLISTKAGGVGVNLVGASRCIIFDASWNPMNDVQAICRTYRFGQVKPVYVYRFVAQGTMEQKIYERQIIKQSMAIRVVDQLQANRHYRAQEVAELYNFDPDTVKDDGGEEESQPIKDLPDDKLLADVLQIHGDIIVRYHEHDSLLENQPHESLSDQEKETAWKEYETESGRKIDFIKKNLPKNSNKPPHLPSAATGRMGKKSNPGNMLNTQASGAELRRLILKQS
ncbi:transcriptional regulator ATRX homolog [Brevipalpus obovatus]|uniref:transcriptional regulator ATRX homolog n=1 Tax=Brevipalpus obovatus TaxID=246614 RepID=UPI003D9F5A58